MDAPVSLPLEPARGFRRWMPFAFFGLAVLGTAIWARLPTMRTEDPVYLHAQREIAGYRFQEVPLGNQVADTLATTNLLNGHFFDARSNRVSVFRASWEPGQGTGGNVFGHTPEICWVGNGFQTLRLGEPAQVLMGFSGRMIPFQCRVLRHPGLPLPEIALWAACIDGQWDGVEFGSPPHLPEGSAPVHAYAQETWRTVVTRWASLRRLLHRRFTQNAQKQFIRFSQPVTTDWQAALTDLERFAHQWLEAQSQP